MTVRAGTCFGYAVRSTLPLRYLRDGNADDALTVYRLSATIGPPMGEVLLQWRPPEAPIAATLRRNGDTFDLTIDGAGRFVIDGAGGRIGVSDHGLRQEERLWGIPAALCFRERGDVAVHAAAVDVNGEAILLAAPRTYGKTTLAAAFWNAGHRVLTEDVTCLRLGEDTRPVVMPGPAMLRVRKDVAAALPIRDAAALGEDDDRVHFALDATRRGDADPVPLRAVVLLRDSDGPPRLERVPADRAIRELWALTFRLPTDDDAARCFQAVAGLADVAPIWDLHRTQRFDELERTVETVVRDA